MLTKRAENYVITLMGFEERVSFGKDYNFSGKFALERHCKSNFRINGDFQSKVQFVTLLQIANTKAANALCPLQKKLFSFSFHFPVKKSLKV